MSVVERPPAADASGRGAAFHSPEGGHTLTVVEPLIFEASVPGRRAVRFPAPSEAARAAADSQPPLPAASLRTQAPHLPEVSELDLLRHFNRLSHLNHAIDLGFYPLGS
jgi:glycine dehydrogenase subunit 2